MSISTIGRIAVVALGLSLTVACGSPAKAPPLPQTNAAAAPQSTRSRLELQIGQAETMTLTPTADGYRITGTQLNAAQIKVQDDRVKLRQGEETRGKVKVKDNGFKIYRNDEVEVLRVKTRPTQQELFSADDRQLGHLANDGAGSAIGTSTISVVAEQGLLVVRRDQDIAAKVPKSVGPRAAAWLAVTELELAQRVATMVYVAEKAQ